MSPRGLDARASRSRVGAAFVAVLAYGYWFTDRQPFSGGAALALLVPVVALIATAEWRRARRAGAPAVRVPRAPRFRSAVVAWSSVAIAVLVWELLALRSLPRSAHPTISSLVQSIEQYHAGRVVLYFAWLWLGWTLAA